MRTTALSAGGAVCFVLLATACQGHEDQMFPPSLAMPPIAVSRPMPASPLCTDSVAPPVPAPLRTFYIDAARGSDGADGTTPQSAWRSLAKANDAAQPGDLFLLSGTFNHELIHPRQSGTPDAKIVYRGSPDGRATIAGGQYDVIVWLDGVSHIVVDNVELLSEVEPVVIRNGANNIWLRRLYIHDAGSAGIYVKDASDNRIEDSRIERVGTEDANAGEGIFLQDGANRNAIVRNTIADAGHGALWISYQNAAEATSDDNRIERNDISNPWASALGLNGKTRRTIVQCNRIHDTADGSRVNYARPGIEVEGDSNVVRYNEIFRSGAQGLTLQGRSLFGFTQNATNNRIYNNTFWQNGRRRSPGDSGGGLESVQLIQMDAGSVRSNTIEQNVFWDDQGLTFDNTRFAITADMYHALVPWVPGNTNGNVVRNNIFPTSQSLLLVIRSGATNDAYTLEHAQAVLSGWRGNLQADPLFRDEAGGDVSIAPGSPAASLGAGAYCIAGSRCILH